MSEPTKSALELLIAERDRLNKAIEILQGEVEAPRRRGRPPGSKNKPKAAKKAGGRGQMSPAARKAVSERMKKYWAQRRKAKK